MPNPIKPREKVVIINALSGGIVPSIGLQHIVVGRKDEFTAITRDLTQIKDGVSRFRLVSGEFGSGKSFFLAVTKTLAHAQDLVVCHADATTERALYSSDGKARALYSELLNNLSTKIKPDGGALKAIVERWISMLSIPEGLGFKDATIKALLPLQKHVAGLDFATVVAGYRDAYIEGNDIKMAQCLKWLKAEYPTRTSAKADLGINTIIDDENYYEYLKLFSDFVRMAGYAGLTVLIDELAVLTRLRKPVRDKNYENLLKIYNNCLPGEAGCFGIFLSGTHESVTDPDRGLASYPALATRLAPNRLEADGVRDFSGPVLKLKVLTKEELTIAFTRIREVFALGDQSKFLMDDSGIFQFLNWCYERLGAQAFLQPRDAIQAFVKTLAQLEQNPGRSWQDLLPKHEAVEDAPTQGPQSLTKLRVQSN